MRERTPYFVSIARIAPRRRMWKCLALTLQAPYVSVVLFDEDDNPVVASGKSTRLRGGSELRINL